MDCLLLGLGLGGQVEGEDSLSRTDMLQGGSQAYTLGEHPGAR